jgi:hypothetical protein
MRYYFVCSAIINYCLQVTFLYVIRKTNHPKQQSIVSSRHHCLLIGVSGKEWNKSQALVGLLLLCFIVNREPNKSFAEHTQFLTDDRRWIRGKTQGDQPYPSDASFIERGWNEREKQGWEEIGTEGVSCMVPWLWLLYEKSIPTFRAQLHHPSLLRWKPLSTHTSSHFMEILLSLSLSFSLSFSCCVSIFLFLSVGLMFFL